MKYKEEEITTKTITITMTAHEADDIYAELGNLEINLNELDNPTLWKLYNIIDSPTSENEL